MRLHPRASTIILSCLAFLACALPAAVPSRAQAEGFECLNDNGAPKVLEPERTLTYGQESAVVRLRIFIVRDDNGQGGATAAEVDSLIAHTRSDYAARSIYFDVDMDTIQCSECLTDPNLVDLHARMANDTARLSAMVFPAPEAWDFSYGRADGIPGRKLWVGIKRGSFDGGGLSHEIGHNLGLYHTFHRFCGAAETQGNCDECGDLVCDTIYDTYGTDIRYHVDPGSCEFDPGVTQPGTPTGDPVNIMTWTWLSCMTSFTGGQTARMLNILEDSEILAGIMRRPAARYENKSGDTNLEYEGTPYSSVVLDYNTDALKDLGLRGILWVNSGGPEPATPYNYRAWAPFGLPQNLLRFPNRSAHEVRPIAA